MVSLRRRRHLGLPTGLPCTSTKSPNPRDGESIAENSEQNLNPDDLQPGPSVDSSENKEDQVEEAIVTTTSDPEIGSSILSPSTSSKEEPVQQYPVPEVKRRKRHRRKHIEDREPCTMRGVYYKNMKWQAAIKVEKKQIHLGTVGSQEEAARLYDRAAFMCGREPNFQLSEEEKQELRRFKWDEFLAITRNAIHNKKKQRRIIAAARRQSETQQLHENWENGHATVASSSSDVLDGQDVQVS